MSRASNFQQNQSRGLGGSVARLAPSGRPTRPRATAEEVKWVLNKHKERPDLSALSIARLLAREFGTFRSKESVDHWIRAHDEGRELGALKRATTEPKYTPKRSVEEIRARRCSAAGCDKPHRSKGLCGMHYTRHLRANQAANETKENTP